MMLGLVKMIEFLNYWSSKNGYALNNDQCIDLANKIITRGRKNTVTSINHGGQNKLSIFEITKRIIDYMLEHGNTIELYKWKALAIGRSYSRIRKVAEENGYAISQRREVRMHGPRTDICIIYTIIKIE